MPVKPIQFVLRAYTKKELRLLYGLSYSTFKRWCDEIPEVKASGRKNWLDILQVEALISKRGAPGEREFQ